MDPVAHVVAGAARRRQRAAHAAHLHMKTDGHSGSRYCYLLP